MKTSLRAASSSIALALLLAACGNKGPLVKPSQVMPPEPREIPAVVTPADATTDAPPAADPAVPVEEGVPATESTPEANPPAPGAAPATPPPVDDGSGG
ncbi:lipoprotein [Luteimonas sp. 50]|uniref:Lipoprotein n=1 Tax=Cognatiluteimonas sedimenti TaxID=2927791 RepID=A0ABT0A798_9GAMM|nr:lipoprotein [Lysobacter sedimenti]MCJ0826835.1 lipoprotein [Lysobacter sedimenti]